MNYTGVVEDSYNKLHIPKKILTKRLIEAHAQKLPKLSSRFAFCLLIQVEAFIEVLSSHEALAYIIEYKYARSHALLFI